MFWSHRMAAKGKCLKLAFRFVNIKQSDEKFQQFFDNINCFLVKKVPKIPNGISHVESYTHYKKENVKMWKGKVYHFMKSLM